MDSIDTVVRGQRGKSKRRIGEMHSGEMIKNDRLGRREIIRDRKK